MPGDKDEFIAPDGGWGWMVVISVALSNFVMIPIMQNFGLIYKDTFEEIGISATRISIIINMNQAFGMILGLLNGPLLRMFGYRKISMLSSLLYGFGVIFTSFATTFIEFAIFYGMMASMGMIMALNSYPLALNTYFKKKRNLAMGISMTLTGLGPILMPFATSFLLSEYGSSGTMLIMGALSLNSLVGAALLQPIKWHAKRVESPVENGKEEQLTNLLSKEDQENKNTEQVNSNHVGTAIRAKTISRELRNVEYDDCHSLFGFETPINLENKSLREVRDSSFDINKYNHEDSEFLKNNIRQRSKSFTHHEIRSKISPSSLESRARAWSTSSHKRPAIIPTCHKILKDCPEEEIEINEVPNMVDSSIPNGVYEPTTIANDQPPLMNANKSKMSIQLQKIADFFDLDLLRDPIYTNIMLGMSIAIFAELNFSTLTPFILNDIHLTTDEIATMMSIIALFDLILRGLAPFLGDWLRKPPRIMYLLSSCLLIMFRTPLIFLEDYLALRVLAIFLGIAKGIRSVYMNLVIPSYVPLNRVAGATAIQYMVNGLLLITIGPLLGYIRDVTGNYGLSLALINSVTGLTVVMWLVEFFILYIRRKTSKDNSQVENNEVRINGNKIDSNS